MHSTSKYECVRSFERSMHGTSVVLWVAGYQLWGHDVKCPYIVLITATEGTECLAPDCNCGHGFFHDLGEWFIWNRRLNRRRAYLAVTITNYGFLAHGEPADGFLRSSFTKTKILMMIPSTTHRWCRMRK